MYILLMQGMFLWVQKRLAPAELPGPSETVLCRYRCIPRFCVRLRSCFKYCSGPYSTSRSRSFFPSCIHTFGVVLGISSLAMSQRSLAYSFRSSIDRALRRVLCGCEGTDHRGAPLNNRFDGSRCIRPEGKEPVSPAFGIGFSRFLPPFCPLLVLLETVHFAFIPAPERI